jgi:starch synthase
MIGIISRLTDQKGLDLVDRAMNDICTDGTQFVVLGTGDRRYEDMFKYYQGIHPAKVSANIYYSDDLSHKMYAACDAMLVPSRFEPCGLTQLMALRYGTLPIVRETGGLKDTVQPYNEFDGTGTGFSFANYDAFELLNTINYSKRIFFDYKENWQNMVERAMQQNYSWANSAKIYEQLYEQI